LSFVISSCNDYLELIPDNVATVDTAFSLRNTAERYLFTCYSWLPDHGSITGNPAFMAGDEFWPTLNNGLTSGSSIAMGLQNVQSPLFNHWDGFGFKGIRDCNIFLDNIHRVPDIEEQERERWIAEVKVLKAYYHFWLMRMYGPIPILQENLPISVSTEDALVSRRPINEVVAYIEQLVDEALENLPLTILDPIDETGRLTKPIALTIKANALTYAASPLFNGNTDYANLKNKDGTQLIDQTYSVDKWRQAADACYEAIEACNEAGIILYNFEQPSAGTVLSDITLTKMSIRNSVAERTDLNTEIIWGNTNSSMSQVLITPRGWDPDNIPAVLSGRYAPPIELMDIFYSKNGIPINEDTTYAFSDRYEIENANEDQEYNIELNYPTIKLHQDRELRFYASVGFDGGYWYGQGKYTDTNNWVIKAKSGQHTAINNANNHSETSYFAKKLINYRNVVNGSSYSQERYAWPIYRLSDLYLMYAEALNEVDGPTAEAYDYVNRIRERAGLQSVQDSWSTYSNTPNKYTSQEGFRSIIQQERMIELIFEGKRYWDLKRWKRASTEFNKIITGWSLYEKTPEEFYQAQLLYQPEFRLRDYLWPISEGSLLRNSNLVQNPGW